MAILGLEAACQRSAARTEAPTTARFDSFPIAQLEGFLTPPGSFFVRDHFGTPPEASMSAGQWTVTVEGDVDRPQTLTLQDLASLTRLDQPVTLECAGNAGRNGLGWPGGPRAWGGASTAAFQGFPLAAVLRRAGPKPGVVEVVLEGCDRGQERGSSEQNAFARSVPLDVALLPSSMLATGMNGLPLPAVHGGPCGPSSRGATRPTP